MSAQKRRSIVPNTPGNATGAAVVTPAAVVPNVVTPARKDITNLYLVTFPKVPLLLISLLN